MADELFGFSREYADRIISETDTRRSVTIVRNQPLVDRVCLVRAYCDLGATAATGSGHTKTPGTGTARVLANSSIGGALNYWTTPSGGNWDIEFENDSVSAVAAGTIVKLMREEIAGRWIVVWEDCG